MAESSDRVFYRILEDVSPTVRDFTSFQALGPQPRRPATLDVLRRWSGISVYETEAQARAVARWRPSIGSFIAAVRIADADPFRWEQTGDPTSGHHTIWGDPAELLSRVVSETPV